MLYNYEQEIILSDCNNSSDGIESNESSSDYDADVTASTSTAHDQVHETAENKDRVDANNENESFPAHVTIDQALHLPLVIDARGNRCVNVAQCLRLVYFWYKRKRLVDFLNPITASG